MHVQYRLMTSYINKIPDELVLLVYLNFDYIYLQKRVHLEIFIQVMDTSRLTRYLAQFKLGLSVNNFPNFCELFIHSVYRAEL